MARVPVLAWGVALLALVACGSAGGTGDDAGLDAPEAADEAQDAVGDGTAELPDDAAPDAEVEVPFVRLRKLQEGETGFGGPNQVALPGDYVLENDAARFVIQGTGRSRSWIPYTGSLVDADVVRPEGQAGRDNLGEVSIVTGLLRSMAVDSFEVLDDGSDGTRAHLRVHGHDAGVPIVDFVIPMPNYHFDVIVDYQLSPGDRALLITTTVTSPKARTVNLGDAIMWGDRIRPLAKGFDQGVTQPSFDGTIRDFVAIGDGVAYGVAPVKGEIKFPSIDADLQLYMGPAQDVEDGGTASYARWFVVGQDVEEVRARLAGIEGEQRYAVSLDVTLDDPQDVEEHAEVVVFDADGDPVAQVWLPAANPVVRLKPGEYTVTTRQLGRPNGLDVAFTVGQGDTSVSLNLPATGRVKYDFAGDDFQGQQVDGLPMRLGLQAGPAADPHAQRLRLVYSATGHGTFLVEPGAWTLTASRGYEYELVQGDVSVAAGETGVFSGYLDRVVDTTGWLAGDFHMHSEASADTTLALEQRLVSMAAVGLERGPLTDHDIISYADDKVQELGLGAWLRLTAGDEVSPVGRHTNGYPMTDRDDRSRYYAVPVIKGYDQDGKCLGGRTFPEIWADMRDNFHAGVIHINHPRDGQGYLDVIKYDPAKGIAALAPGVFDSNFDGLELINSADVNTCLNTVLADWISFVNQGLRIAALAVSDSHTLWNPGDSRTFFRTGQDDPRACEDQVLVASLKGQHTVAASGPFVEASIGDKGPGDIVEGAGPHELVVKVQAPSWMPVDWVRVLVNGVQLEERAVEGGDVARFLGSFALPGSEKDYWVTVLVGAPTKDMAPVSPGAPVLSITSAIYVDVAADGWDAPGLPQAR
jgi:hypothetical protein